MAKYRYTYFIQAYDREGREIDRPTLRSSEADARMTARYRVIPMDFIEHAWQVRVTRCMWGNYEITPVMMVWFDKVTQQPKVSKRKEDLIK